MAAPPLTALLRQSKLCNRDARNVVFQRKEIQRSRIAVVGGERGTDEKPRDTARGRHSPQDLRPIDRPRTEELGAAGLRGELPLADAGKHRGSGRDLVLARRTILIDIGPGLEIGHWPAVQFHVPA